MSQAFAFLLAYVGFALISSKVLAYLLERRGVPSVLAEVVLGVFMGMYVIGRFPPFDRFMARPEFAIPFDVIAHMGILFLLFIAGMEIDPMKLVRTGPATLLTSAGGVVVPLAFGLVAGLALGFSWRESLVIGVILTATSIGITVRTFLRMGILDTEVGAVSLSASIIDDFVGIFLIILIVDSSPVPVLAGMLLVFVGLSLLMKGLMPGVMKAAERVSQEGGTLAFVIGLMFLMAALAEFTLAAAIEGAFVMGVLLRMMPGTKTIRRDVQVIGYAMFIPLFFIYVGTLIDPLVFADLDVLVVAAVILVAGVAGKIIGKVIGARLCGFGRDKAFFIGVASIPRMEIALVTLMIAVRADAIADDRVKTLIAAVMVLVIVTTLTTPLLLARLWHEDMADVPPGRKGRRPPRKGPAGGGRGDMSRSKGRSRHRGAAHRSRSRIAVRSSASMVPSTMSSTGEPLRPNRSMTARMAASAPSPQARRTLSSQGVALSSATSIPRSASR
ncbi:MAG: cation:proton antiporter [Thermoplasmata archaeon]|nr:cation:proton antiporter [Thermoplasmata archaeon]